MSFFIARLLDVRMKVISYIHAKFFLIEPFVFGSFNQWHNEAFFASLAIGSIGCFPQLLIWVDFFASLACVFRCFLSALAV